MRRKDEASRWTWRMPLLFGIGLGLGAALGVWWAATADAPVTPAAQPITTGRPTTPAPSDAPGPADSPPAMLIEPADLELRLDEDQLRIVDSRSHAEYLERHLPEAVWVDVERWQRQGEAVGGFHDQQAWSELVGALGIDHAKTVVVYGDHLPDAARIWWTLKYLGVSQALLLNGGWQLWQSEERPTAAGGRVAEATEFAPRWQPDRLAELDTLRLQWNDEEVTIVDARSDEEFLGREVRGQRGGHIPGAKHLEWKQLLAADGRFQPAAQLRELFQQHGIQPDATTICH